MRRVEKSGIIQQQHFRLLFRRDNKSSISILDYRMEMLFLSFGGVRNGMRFLKKICRGLTAAYFKERTGC